MIIKDKKRGKQIKIVNDIESLLASDYSTREDTYINGLSSTEIFKREIADTRIRVKKAVRASRKYRVSTGKFSGNSVY